MTETQKRHLEQHLMILGEMPFYCVLDTKYTWQEETQQYAPGNVNTTFLPRKDVIPWIETHDAHGAQCWLSLNRKDLDSTDGVTHIQCIWVDIDAKRESKTRPARAADSLDALSECCTFQRYMRDTYGVTGFTACSGNGYHVYYPVEPYNIAPAYRHDFNTKHRAFLNKMRHDSNVCIDTTTDIRRVTQPIGAANLKLPGTPLHTYWIDDYISSDDIKHARYNNDILLEMIVGMRSADVPKGQIREESLPNEIPPPSRELMDKLETAKTLDTKLAHLYDGHWKHYPEYTDGKRSAAELALVTLLFRNGFTEHDVLIIMPTAKIGKWNERKDEGYRDRTIQRAHI